MSKKPEQPKVISTPRNITDILETNYMPYTMSVIVSRAIPEIDGFKPAHRKLLYTMYKMGLLNGPKRKSADVVGQTMQLNPHGEGAIYETLVRLTRGNDALLHPFIDSKGNFGKQYSRDMAYAASRYTEVKLDGICGEVFRDIDKNAVQFIDNYNGLMKEPVLLPTVFPNVLVSPNQGIAVGMASNICGFNLKEVCEAAIAYIKNKNVDLLSIIKAPDFSTGGEVIYKEDELRAIYKTGRGSFKVRAKYRYDKKNSCIEIYQIPYTTTIEAIIDKIAALVKAGKIRDILDVRDETDLNGLKIAIDIRKSASAESIMNRLYTQTPLIDAFGCNFNVLINGRPKTLGIAGILDEWLIFRGNCIKRRAAHDLERCAEKLHLLTGLEKILLDIDRAIRIIRETDEDRHVIGNLMDGFGIDRPQAEFIAEIKLRNLNREYFINRINERGNLQKEADELRAVLDDPKRIDQIITAELKEVIKKHGKPRRTDISYVPEEIPAAEDLIDDYALKLFLTEHNYLKKISLISLRSSGEQYLKDGDRITQEVECSNKTELLMFSDRQNVYKLKAHELSDCKASGMGEYLTNALGLDDGERIIYITPTYDYSGFMIFAYENGKAAKVGLDAYATKTNRKKLINAYSDKSKLVASMYIPDDTDFFALRGRDKAMLFNTSLISSVSVKNSGGIQVFTLKKNSVLSAFIPADKLDAADLEFYRAQAIPSAGHFIMAENIGLVDELFAGRQ